MYSLLMISVSLCSASQVTDFQEVFFVVKHIVLRWPTHSASLANT